MNILKNLNTFEKSAISAFIYSCLKRSDLANPSELATWLLPWSYASALTNEGWNALAATNMIIELNEKKIINYHHRLVYFMNFDWTAINNQWRELEQYRKVIPVITT